MKERANTQAQENTISRFAEANKRIDEIKARSAWKRGVKEYAHDILSKVEDIAEFRHTAPETREEFLKMALNSAESWARYSYGGNSLCCNYDIAERLCTPSELKRKKGGELQPNSQESWLDVQARALSQAYIMAKSAYFASRKER